MNTHGMPNGDAVDVADEVACLVWAMYFAHAQAGMGLRLTFEEKAVRIESVYAPINCAADVRVSFDGGDFCDCSEQSPLLITLDACRALIQGPPQRRMNWFTHAQNIASTAADEWIATACS
jgi:hypothetical protein